ncbi:hypothetical protein NMY22_g17075 [Coprinellus aureogranulatus]|nr:hypothetical protein NMY22_g17075 [Coprinellus aureogranulatus]
MKRGRAGNDTQVISSLLKNNDPLSDDQRVVLSTRLRDLEDEYQRVVGKPYTSGIKENQIPRAAKGPHRAIQLRRTLLCGVRSIPDEILQTIFELVVFDEDGDHDPTELRRLCKTSRRWRQAAIGHCVLWTKLNHINLTSTKPSRILRTTNRLRHYLTHSGDLPFSFKLWVHHSIWDKDKSPILEPIQLLMDQCHRWGNVQLRTPLSFYEHLSPIRGKIPALRELDIDTDWRSDEEPANKKLSIDCFADAPSLRNVHYDTRYAFRSSWPDGDSVLHFSFPWSQLHEFSTSTLCDTSYRDLLAAQPLQLRELDYNASSVSMLHDTDPITLPNLEKFVFRTYELTGGLDLLAHLDLLTLPALTHLEIRGLSSVDMGQLYERVLSLVIRSKCSLQRLCIQASEGLAHDRWMPCFKLLLLCPELTHLLISSPQRELLNSLVLNPTSPAPILPKLKALVIRNSDVNGVSNVPDATAIMEVVKSRTEGLPEGMKQALEEVTFIWDDSELLQLQLAFLEAAESPSDQSSTSNIVQTEAEVFAAKARETLNSQFTRWWHGRRAYFNLKLHGRMNAFMSSLENMDMDKQDARPLMRRGIPYLLRSMSDRCSGRIPGDRLFRFRSRAAKLCEKWKPFLLRDSKPYYWCFTVEETASMRWTPSEDSGDDNDSEEARVWKDISGQSELSGKTLSWF